MEIIFYPKATSSAIITAKPSIAPHVPRCGCLSAFASGIISSATTKIIAPAANAKSHGCAAYKYAARK